MIKAIIISLVIIIFTICYMMKHMRSNTNKNMISKVHNKNTHNNNKQSALKKVNDKFLDEEFLRIYHDIEYNFIEEAKYYNNHCCPNCGSVFEKEIKTSKICPQCKKKITKRSNYLTKQCYLIGIDKLTLYIKYEERLQKLNFFEEKLKKLNCIETNLKTVINKYRNKSGIVSERDLIWNVCNELSINYTNKAYKIVHQSLKKNFDDNFNNLEIARQYFSKNLCIQRIRIDIAEYENKTNVVETLFPQYIYYSICTHLLLYKYYFNNITESKILEAIDTYQIMQYLKKYSKSTEQFLEQYKAFARGFVLPVITPEETWIIIKKALFQKI